MPLISQKLAQAAAILDELDIDCWLTFVRETTETGDPVLPLILGQPVTWQSAFILTSTAAGAQRIAIVGKYEDDAVKSAGGDGKNGWTTVLPYVQSIRSPLVTTLKRINPRQIAINYSMDDVKSDGLSHGMMLLLREYLRETPYVDRFISAAPIINALRSRKSRAEVERMRSAIAITEEIFAETAKFVRPGVSELEISQFMHRECDRRGVQTAWDRAQCPIVTTGPQSMIGHGLPSHELAVAPGNVFHLDFGVRLSPPQYCSDMQRAWYVPREGQTKPPAPPIELQRAFDTIVRALEVAFETLKPGVEGWQVDAAARQVITGAGYPEYQHATGHNVGRAAHDGGCVLGPRWERYGRTPFYKVEPGNVFTLELGIDNAAGCGYLGLEEMVHVTQTGCEWLTTPQTKLPMLVNV